jgi:hypothetical protein
MTEQLSVPINWWADMPKIVELKTVLTLYTLEIEVALSSLSVREADILRWTVLFLHLGSAKYESRTSK